MNKKCSSCKSKIIPKIIRNGKYARYSCPVCGNDVSHYEIKGPVGLNFCIILSILFIVIGVKFTFYYGGVTPDKLDIIESTVDKVHCRNNIRQSDYLDITFIDIKKYLIVKPVIYCNQLAGTLLQNQKVTLWLESDESTINLWGLQSEGRKLIWPTAGFVNTRSINFFSVLLAFWGLVLGRKAFRFMHQKQPNKNLKRDC